MGQFIDREDIENISESVVKSKICERITSIPIRILNFVWNCFLYGPGVGIVSTERKGREKTGTVTTSVGNLTIPIMKMISFEISIGFFLENREFEEGLQELDKFENTHNGIPRSQTLKTNESYWILNYRRPKDVMGTKEIYFFVVNELDNLIFIYKISNNDLIDYEKMIDLYETKLDNLEYIENEINENEDKELRKIEL